MKFAYVVAVGSSPRAFVVDTALFTIFVSSEVRCANLKTIQDSMSAKKAIALRGAKLYRTLGQVMSYHTIHP